MRTHHWLLILALLFIVLGFFWLAALVVKVILWAIGAGLLIGAITGFASRRRGP